MSKRKAKKSKGKSKNYYSSMRLSIAAAESGDLEAQHNVGACYATGEWDGPKDECEAIKCYARAAESGHLMSQYDLGFMLILGEGTEKNLERGIWWIEQAARGGDKQAARLLSDLYKLGLHGVEIDQQKASYWSKRSVDLEDGSNSQ